MQSCPTRRIAGRTVSADANKYDDVRRNRRHSKFGGSTIEEETGRKLSLIRTPPGGTNMERNGVAKFPKLEDCMHFHYDTVDIGNFQASLYEGSVSLEDKQHSSRHHLPDVSHNVTSIYLEVKSPRDHTSWVIERNLDGLCKLDRRLHQCVFDRKYSMLPSLQDILLGSSPGNQHGKMQEDNLRHTISLYFHRLSAIAGNMVNCAAILSWFEMDNRGNRIIVASDSDSAINIPAVGAALVVKRYTAQVPDEISLEVGEIISLIDMSPLHESSWWRGKRKFEVGFFPADCVEVISGKIPKSVVAIVPQKPIMPVLRKRGKLIVRLRAFFSSRPARNQLKSKGIVKERVFGCDLGELLLNSGHDVPSVLKFCTDVIETYGIVDGVYRLSGITSNIQKLRQEFDEDCMPALTDDIFMRDIHSISSLLKMYFRELPNPLLTYQLYDKFVAAIQDEDNRLLKVYHVIQQLPPPHYRTCAYLMKHLNKMASYGKKTCMTGRNLAIVWAPNLLRCKELEQMQCNMTALKSVGIQAVVTEFLITHADLLFDEKVTSSVVFRRSNSGGRRLRPKSLAVSTPTKLLSLEEARLKALKTGSETSQQLYLDVGGGPSTLPSVYHTVVDLPKRSKSGHRKKGSSTPSLKYKDLSSTSSEDSKNNSGTTRDTSSCHDNTSGCDNSQQIEMPPSVAGQAGSIAKRSHQTSSSTQSFCSSTPYSTPLVENCSLEDVKMQAIFHTSANVNDSAADSFQRSHSVGYDQPQSSSFTSRRLVHFARGTDVKSVSGTCDKSSAKRLSMTLREESLCHCSGSSSDEVFISATCSREGSVSPSNTRVEAITKRNSNKLSGQTSDSRLTRTADDAAKGRHTEVCGAGFSCCNGTESESCLRHGINGPSQSTRNHCNSENDEDDDSISFRSSVDKFVDSNVDVLQSTTASGLHRQVRAPQGSAVATINLYKDSDEFALSDSWTDDLTHGTSNPGTSLLSIRDGGHSISTPSAKGRSDSITQSSTSCSSRPLGSGCSASSSAVTSNANHKTERCVRRGEDISNASKVSLNQCREPSNDLSRIFKGIGGRCDEWPYIDDTDDDELEEPLKHATSQRTRKTLIMPKKTDDATSVTVSSSPFTSPPRSPVKHETAVGYKDVVLRRRSEKRGSAAVRGQDNLESSVNSRGLSSSATQIMADAKVGEGQRLPGSGRSGPGDGNVSNNAIESVLENIAYPVMIRSDSASETTGVFASDENFMRPRTEAALLAMSPNIVQEAEGLRAASGVSMRKKSVKELKSKFEQSSGSGEMSATLMRKTPPQYSRSQAHHGFQASESSFISPNESDNSTIHSSKLGVLSSLDAIPHIIDREQSKSALDDGTVAHSRCSFKSIDEELEFIARYSSVPSVSARISCFEPLMSAPRVSPEFHNTPVNKRARLSSVGNCSNRHSVTVLDNSIVFVNSNSEDGGLVASEWTRHLVSDPRYRSPIPGCDLLSLLDIPPSSAKSLPRVSERKRLFENESARSLNCSHVSCSAQTSLQGFSKAEEADNSVQTPSGRLPLRADKENTCIITSTIGETNCCKMLFNKSELENSPSIDCSQRLAIGVQSKLDQSISMSGIKEPGAVLSRSVLQRSFWSRSRSVPSETNLST